MLRKSREEGEGEGEGEDILWFTPSHHSNLGNPLYSSSIPVVIEGVKDSQPLDADTVLWNKDKTSIGKVSYYV